MPCCSDAAEPRSEHSERACSTGGLRGGSVLVVEDDDDLRSGLQDILEAEGYSVSTAVNGRDALDRLSALVPQLILLDLMMPVMNGVEFLSALRQHETLSATPVVVISAWPKEAQAVDAQGFLAKPINLKVLLSVVQRFCMP